MLINGHRIDSFSGEVQGVTGVNLAAIPFAAIDRVEILKDGASAVYGSDATAGVINFITRNDYTGAEVTGFTACRRGGGGEQFRARSRRVGATCRKTAGTLSSRARTTNRSRWTQADRNFSNSSYIPDIGLIGISSNTYPGRVTTGGIGVISNGHVANSLRGLRTEHVLQ